jgi:trehalose/maltose hydrolase-like predicted phosphorylase
MAEKISATTAALRHGSSLQRGCAVVAARLGDAEMALRYLHDTTALDLDLDPTAPVARIAELGALWRAVILGFAGSTRATGLGSIEASAPMAQPLVPRVLERPVRLRSASSAEPCRRRWRRARRWRCASGTHA